MKILIIDCSQGNRLGLILDNECYNVEPSDCEKKSDNILLKIDELLKLHNLSLNDLDCLATNIGPGSFTGLRVAITLVKALSICNNLKVVAFNSFEAIEYNDNKDKTIFIIDGFGSFVFTSFKDKKDCMEICEVKKLIDKFNLKVCCSKNVAEKLGIHNFIVNLPNICKIAQNKYNNGEFLNVDKLEPLYLRASQAEIEREKKLKNGNKI